MKDSQPLPRWVLGIIKYIKVNNERFSTGFEEVFKAR